MGGIFFKASHPARLVCLTFIGPAQPPLFMKNIFLALLFSLAFVPTLSQPTKIKADKYPSLLWEIKGPAGKPSYLFGTMHVSSKMVFHLSDSFYLAIKNAQAVALETNPGTWQEDFSRYDLESERGQGNRGRYDAGYDYGFASVPSDYLTINSLRLVPFEKKLEAALYSSPAIINSFLYRTYSDAASDFEEDTYLDLHIFQTGSKLGKRMCGVENFDGSMQLVKEAYRDAAKEKKKPRGYDYDNDFSYARMEEAYRTGNLDLLDTINKVNSQSAAFDEKFLYKRNEVQAFSIDSILRSGTTLFVGVGAAHLPGTRGVIELLRKKGYSLRPVRMTERSSLQKERLEKIRVPVVFQKQAEDNGLYSVSVPGKLYSFGRSYGGIEVKQAADMVNGSYYMVTRIFTNAAIMGQSEEQVLRKLDSVLYENIPGKILSKVSIVKNGYRGYDITNRTRRGDVQRYAIFVMPFEVLLFKMSGTGDYVKNGTEAAQFFGSIQLRETKPERKKWSPFNGGFEVEMPHQPIVFKGEDWVFAAIDTKSKTAVEVVRTDVHNYDFLEEDSFDLRLMEESFATSDCIERNLSRQWTNVGGYKALDATYRCKDSSLAKARFLIQGPHYYTLLVNANTATADGNQFLSSFAVKPFRYGSAKEQADTAVQFKVRTPVPLEKPGKLQMYPDDYFAGNDAVDSLVDRGRYKTRLVVSDSTGEKILVSFYKPSLYASRLEAEHGLDSAEWKKEWVVRKQKKDTLANGLAVLDAELGNKKSSRLLKEKSLTKDGAGYAIITLVDTLSGASPFVSSFFESFVPLDTLVGKEGAKKKTELFFAQFFSRDSLLHKKAVANIGELVIDSSGFSKLKKSIETLSWQERKYLQVKKDFIGKLAFVQTKEAAGYLKLLYEKAGDTVALQYAALEALLAQETTDAYNVFGQIMQTDPPVLDASTGDVELTSGRRRSDDKQTQRLAVSTASNGYFLEHLTDSLALTASIFKQILPLVNVDDYEQPLMDLTGVLIDSGYLRAVDYESYLPKFLLEAKQALKKQLIREKSKAIAKAKKNDDAEDETTYAEQGLGAGNERLQLYATLLVPFWDRHPQVQPVLNQLLQSGDKRIRYSTAMLLLRNQRAVPDTLWNEFATLDDFRYELYTDLKKQNKTNLFPAPYKTQQQLLQSRLYSLEEYSKPDTLAYVTKLPLQYKDYKGYVHVFKYKEKKDDYGWKLATAGLVPEDSTQLMFDEKMLSKEDEQTLDLTDFTNTKLTADTPEDEQLEKLRKRLSYTFRKSAARFYLNESRYDEFEYPRMR